EHARRLLGQRYAPAGGGGGRGRGTHGRSPSAGKVAGIFSRLTRQPLRPAHASSSVTAGWSAATLSSYTRSARPAGAFAVWRTSLNRVCSPSNVRAADSPSSR